MCTDSNGLDNAREDLWYSDPRLSDDLFYQGTGPRWAETAPICPRKTYGSGILVVDAGVHEELPGGLHADLMLVDVPGESYAFCQWTPVATARDVVDHIAHTL